MAGFTVATRLGIGETEGSEKKVKENCSCRACRPTRPLAFSGCDLDAPPAPCDHERSIPSRKKWVLLTLVWDCSPPFETTHGQKEIPSGIRFSRRQHRRRPGARGHGRYQDCPPARRPSCRFSRDPAREGVLRDARRTLPAPRLQGVLFASVGHYPAFAIHSVSDHGDPDRFV